MRRTVRSAAAVLLVTACHAPLPSTSITGEGIRSEHALRQEPHRAAVCVARNIDRGRPELEARIREGLAPALIEVEVHARRVVALARFFLSGEASTAVIWIDRQEASETLVQIMVNGC